jgi:cobalt/nickel transport system permease protein
MMALFPESFAPANPRSFGLVSRWPAGVKLAVALGLIAGTALVPARWTAWFWGVGLVLVAVMLVGKMRPWPLLLRLLALSPFVAGVALAAAWRHSGGLDWKILALRSGLCLATAILLASTTPFGELLAVLRRARVPGLLITTLALMQRYLFVLGDESERMRRARASRTFTRSRWLVWRTSATVVGQLFVRASERAEHVYDAMCARGWR